MFKAALDYHELNAGAHRKPPKILTAPSLIWHLAFWTNCPVLNREGKKSKRSPAELKSLLDEYILALCAGMAGKVADLQLAPSISGVWLLFGSACDEISRAPVEISDLSQRQEDIFKSTTRAVSLQFTWKKLDVTIRFEVYTEYFSISTFVELDKTREKIKSGGLYSGIDSLNDKIELALCYLDPANHTSDAVGSSSQLSDDDLGKELNKYFFHDFWEFFESKILLHGALADLAKDEIFKQIFADFRGFIASDQAVKFPDAGFFEGDEPPAWGQEAKKKFLPLIQHRDRGQHIRYECAANYMLDGRALYMSTLGPQLPSMPAEKRVPVEFFVYAHQRYSDTTIVNKWQLGRLVSQILLLGTLRLAALKDVKSLHNAGQLLGHLDEVTRVARDAVAAAEAEASASKEGHTQFSKPDQPNLSAEQTMNELLYAAHKKLNDVSGNFLDETGSGLTYRIERSRYYVKQFDDNVKLLRIRRLEGAQPYDQFIRRRLGSEFDFIDRLGIRYERAVRTMETLGQDRLRGLQVEISGETNSIQSDIQTIQAGGEAILLAFLVPYYVSHLLVLILGEGASYIPVLTVNVWLIGFAIAVGRISKQLTLSTALRFFLLLFVVLAMLFPFESEVLDRLGGSKRSEKAGTLRENSGAEIQRQLIEMQDLQKHISESQRKLEQSAEEGISLLKRSIQPQTTSPDKNRTPAPVEPPTREPKP
ncbi:MAG: hypothetical protein QOI05_2332 [Bradyrhizobium sp.]|nr:hypothetical protein [Bradyrhizobium sp.]